jgi:hypothetical protein
VTDSLQGLHSKTAVLPAAFRLNACSVILSAQFGHGSGRSSKDGPCALRPAIDSNLFCSIEGTRCYGPER